VGMDDVRGLLDRFAVDIGRVVPMVALWAHGSLALGDFQPGRSDLDLVALVGAAITDTQRQELKLAHEELVTLGQGRLITKREALDVLTAMGAPAEVVDDIYQRRYGTGSSLSTQWRARRGQLAQTYVRAGIERVLALPEELSRPGG